MIKQPIFVAAIAALSCLSTETAAQAGNAQYKDSATYDLAKWLTSTYSFRQPLAEFTPLPDGSGYTCAQYKATIRHISFPGTLVSFREDLRNNKWDSTSRLTDTATHQIGDKKFLVVVTTEISPDKSRYEDQVTVTVITEQQSLLLGVVGIYPASLDGKLRQHFIKSGYTITMEKR